MGKATGVFLVLAGLGTAAFVLPTVDRDAERQLNDIVRIATGTPPAATATAPRATAATSPVAAATSPAQVAAVRAAAITTGSVESGHQSLTTDRPKLVVAPPPTTLATDNQTASTADLTRAIQAELRRVGCYSGEVTGDWNEPTKKSMRLFVQRVNATLPVDEPDHILKMLVQGHPGDACGTSCPPGRKLSEGRCLPAAITAQKPTILPKHRRALAAESNAAETPKAASATPSKTTASVASAAGSSTATKSSWSTTVATVTELPAPAAAPLPGRMSIGAPPPSGERPQPGVSLSTAEPLALAAPKRVAAKPVDPPSYDEDAQAAQDTPSAQESRRARTAPEKSRAANRGSSRVVAVPRPTQIYRSSSYTLPTTPRRFGPHIFSDTRWGR